MKSTADWEALLDGITAGPWEYGEFEHCPYADMEDRATIHGGPMPETPYPCGCEEGGTCQVQRCIVGTEDGVWADNPAFWEVNPVDMKAAAHLPEAVAELVRLRREVAAFRDQMTKSAKWRKTMYDGGDDTGHLLGAEYDRQIASRLTRILEGGNQ